jgi:ATP synthase protein I
MRDKQDTNITTRPTKFGRQIGEKAARKLNAQRNPAPGVWFGLGMMGIVGWSVVVPTLAGAALGIWLDNRYPGIHSWTLSLLVIGLAVGCLNAWHWVAAEIGTDTGTATATGTEMNYDDVPERNMQVKQKDHGNE